MIETRLILLKMCLKFYMKCEKLLKMYDSISIIYLICSNGKTVKICHSFNI